MDANFFRKTNKKYSGFIVFLFSILSFTLGVWIQSVYQNTNEAEELCLQHWQVITSRTTSKGSIYCKVSATPEIWQAIKESQVLKYRRSK